MLSRLRDKWRDVPPTSMFTLGVAIGVAIGIVLGIAINNLVIGIPIGAGVGVGIGMALEQRQHTVHLRRSIERTVLEVAPEMNEVTAQLLRARASGPPARAHHYVFAHKALPQLFFKKPTTFVAALGNRREALLEQIWHDVGRWVTAKEGTDARLPSDGLVLTVREVGPGSLALIISLPPPEGFTEAHFVGLLLHPPRYITLEHGFDIRTGGTRTFLCEWSERGHLNTGDGPEATVDAFAETLCGMVREQGGGWADSAALPEASS